MDHTDPVISTTTTTYVEPPHTFHLYTAALHIRNINLALRHARPSAEPVTLSGHAGGSGIVASSLSHLASGFLLSEFVTGGIDLRFSLPGQYLFYAAKIPLLVSPVSDLHLFVDRAENHPLADFLAKGLQVVLGTDAPTLYSEFDHLGVGQSALFRQYECAVSAGCLDKDGQVPGI